MKPSIAFFDFDGTITSRDTLFGIIRYQKGALALYAGMGLLLPALVLFRLKLVSSHTMKQLVLRLFFRGTPEAAFRERCAAFCREALPQLLRAGALKAIQEHQAAGHRVVVVTASAQDWVAPWCAANGLECIGTRLEVLEGRITGRIQGHNCNGYEKVRRICQQIHLPGFGDIYAYGDSSGDRAMLGMATHAYFRKF